MTWTMFWHGGTSYEPFSTHEPRDAEEFHSIRDAVRDFESRPGDPYYPCVDRCPAEQGGPSAWLFYGTVKDVIGRDYPDRVIEFGPLGGIRVYKA